MNQFEGPRPKRIRLTRDFEFGQEKLPKGTELDVIEWSMFGRPLVKLSDRTGLKHTLPPDLWSPAVEKLTLDTEKKKRTRR